MPVYNAEKYLDKSIKSVLEQTEKDYELILVNDGSTDKSLDICKKWQNRYPDVIRVIDKENSGSLFTRRRCLEESKGDYLYIMDADDTLVNKDMLKIIKSTIIQYTCDLVFFNCITNKNSKDRYLNLSFKNNDIFEKESLAELYKQLLIGSSLNTLWSKVFSRKLVDWNEKYNKYSYVTNGTDMFQSIPIISNANKAVYIDKCFYCYTLAEKSESIIHTFKPTVYQSLRCNFIRLKEYSEKWLYGVDNKEELLKIRFMNSASTSAMKIRLDKKLSKKECIEYLKEISNDEMFREMFTLKGISFPRKVIVLLLYLKILSPIFFISKLI
jgi:glycosyltransferase involved in cell wall biosynthesis